jgi:hypothetical protein
MYIYRDLALECQHVLSEHHWTTAVALTALMRSFGDMLIANARRQACTRQQGGGGRGGGSGKNEKNEGNEENEQEKSIENEGKNEDNQPSLPDGDKILNVVGAVLSWNKRYMAGFLEEANLTQSLNRALIEP